MAKNYALYFAIPALLILFIMLLVLRFLVIDQIKNDLTTRGQVISHLNYVIPCGIVLIPLGYLFNLAIQRSRAGQMEMDNFAQPDASMAEDRDMPDDKDEFSILIWELRGTILPTAKVKVLKVGLRNLKVTVKQAEILVAEFEDPVNRQLAEDLLAEKISAQKGKGITRKGGKKGGMKGSPSTSRRRGSASPMKTRGKDPRSPRSPHSPRDNG